MAECLKVDFLSVRVLADRGELGRIAAHDVAQSMRRRLQEKSEIRMIFAAAPSQNEFLDALVHSPDIDWSRVTAFQMDEYIGLDPIHPSAFQNYLQAHLFHRVNPGRVLMLDSQRMPDDECRRYADLVQEAPIDIVCLGIGENGHIAFNDPDVADFNDELPVKRVKLDLECRLQQVHDGCFARLEDVPTEAITLTIPTLMSGEELFCMVPGSTKQIAVQNTLQGPIHERCPASILRRHPQCNLYLDQDSGSAVGHEG